MKHAVIVILAAATRLAPAQPAPPTPQPAEKDKPAPSKGDPTLDELLGLPKPASPKPADGPGTPDQPKAAPKDPSRAELERQLSPGEVSEQFHQAVRLMDETAKRVEDAGDTGVDTQRLQEEVLRKLDKLIQEARRQQNQQRQRQSQSQQRQQQQQQPKPQQQQQQQQASNSPAQTDNLPGVPRRDGPGRSPRAGGAAQWGNLPARLREALQESLDEHFSAMYRSKTEEYYKRLAEEPRTPAPPSTPGSNAPGGNPRP